MCPSDPGQVPQYLDGVRATQVLPQPATSWGLQQTTNPANGGVTLAYWCSYSINEHITDLEATKGSPNLSAWQEPARNYMIMEASDSEIEGDELDELLFQHAAGTNVLYMDGHVKWLKVSYANNNPKVASNWAIPPSSAKGGDTEGGPWSAPADD